MTTYKVGTFPDKTLDLQVQKLVSQARQPVGSRFKITKEGGYAVRLINNTGAASVKGTVVSASTSIDYAFVAQSVEFDAIGIVYESGIPAGSLCWVVIAGIVDVLLKDTTAATRGYWVKCSATDGRAEVTTAPASLSALSTSDHFKEIGHCIESKTSGTNVLARIVLHFN